MMKETSNISGEKKNKQKHTKFGWESLVISCKSEESIISINKVFQIESHVTLTCHYPP